MRTKRVAVLTSGGDAPGMNAVIRSAVRAGLNEGWEMSAYRHGYQGLIEGDLLQLGPRDVGGIVGCGGTVLHTARSPEFKTPEGQQKGLNSLKEPSAMRRSLQPIFINIVRDSVSNCA